MTLRQLRQRLNEVFTENERIATLGWDGGSNRNDLPLAIRLESHPLKSNGKYGYKSRFITIDRLESSRTGLDGRDVVCFKADEIEGHLWPPAKPVPAGRLPHAFEPGGINRDSDGCGVCGKVKAWKAHQEVK